MTFKPGQIFFVIQNKTIIQKGINAVQSFYARLRGRDKSESPHTGVIVDETGRTFESRLKIGHYHMNDYIGCHIRMYEFDNMTPERFRSGYEEIVKHEGQIYPVHRFLFFLGDLAEELYPLPKLVCSEIASKFLFFAGLRNKHYRGTDVDELEDELQAREDVKLPFDGKLSRG